MAKSNQKGTTASKIKSAPAVKRATKTAPANTAECLEINGDRPHGALPEVQVTHAGATPRKKFSTEDWAVLKKARHFRSLGHKRVGMLFSGGPAPGANAVIATATIQFLNDGYEVIGFYKGYEYLQRFNRT